MLRLSPARSSLSLALALLTACGGSADGSPRDSGSPDDGVADANAPTPGASGALTADNPTTSSVDLSWTAATDDMTAGGALEYRVYLAANGPLDTVENVVANGTPATEWQTDLSSLTVDALSLETAYLFNVLVRDEYGNIAAYAGATATTSGGAWGAVEPLETYTGGSVYYSRLSTNPRGDVTARWSLQPTWETHYVTRPTDDTDFGPLTAWGSPGTSTERLPYDGDERLVSATLRRNADVTADILFGAGTPNSPPTFDEAATGLDRDWTFSPSVCVAEDGDVMVVWIDGTDVDAVVARARIRQGTTWGSNLSVSASAGSYVRDVRTICDPSGDHIVLYEDRSAATTVVRARVYDASAGDWVGPADGLGAEAYFGELDSGRTADGRAFVAWGEYDADTNTHFVRVRTHDGSSWSAATELASRTTDSYDSIRVVAAGDDVLVAWTDGTALVGRRLPSGSSDWQAPANISAAITYDLSLSGNAWGDVLAVWVESGSIQSRRYVGDGETWGAIVPLKEGGESVGSGSLAGIVDSRRRATVVYTEWNPTESDFNAFARTYR